MLSRIFESKGFEFISKIVDVALVSMYFIFCSIPIITIGTSMTSLYYVTHKCIVHGRGYTTEFFHAFKDNFKQTTLSWLIFLAIFAVTGADFYVVKYMFNPESVFYNMWIIFAILILAAVVWVIYHFAYTARFANSFKDSFKLSGTIAILNLGYSLLILIIVALVCLLAYILPFLAFFAPTIIALSIHPILEKVFRKYMSEEDQALEDERNGKNI